MDVHAAYATQATQTASPAQLVLMLYDGALDRIERAVSSLAADPPDTAAAHETITRVQAIVAELVATLDHQRGGDLAGHLAGLYAYVTARLLDANVRKDPAPLREAAEVLRPLRDAWEQACCTLAASA